MKVSPLGFSSRQTARAAPNPARVLDSIFRVYARTNFFIRL